MNQQKLRTRVDGPQSVPLATSAPIEESLPEHRKCRQCGNQSICYFSRPVTPRRRVRYYKCTSCGHTHKVTVDPTMVPPRKNDTVDIIGAE